MSYKLYSDKTNNFSCNVQIKGASLTKSKARLIIESNDLSYVFNGSIDSEGKCEITIPKTKNFLSENKSGNMKLEIIADDLLFEPWNSNFVIKASKNVKVKVDENKIIKPEINVLIKEQKEPEIFYSKEELAILLKKNR